MDTDPAACAALHFDLHVALTLRPEGLQPTWQADLLGTSPGESLHFESMPALIHYLASLQCKGPPSCGIR